MFNLFSKKNSTVVAPVPFPFSTDIHSHILPGIDDGAPDVATSLQLIKGLYGLGIRKYIVTPHIIADLYRNDANSINAALEITKAACWDEGIDMEITAAAEYMLDDYFMQLLREKKPLLTLHKNLLLTEFPYSIAPDNIEEMVFKILTEGYQPILAHPERYHYFHRHYDFYYRLKELGFLLQVNLLSLTGYYGTPVKKAAGFILKNELASLTGTDKHNRKIFNDYFSEKKWNQLEELAK